MKLHHTEYKKNYKKYILDCVELDCEEKPIKTDEEKIKYIFDRCNSEFGWNIERIKPLTDQNIYALAKEFAASVKSGSVKAKPEVEDSASGSKITPF